MNAPTTMIPQANPGAGYLAQKAEIDAAVARALASGWYILGKEGEAFEQEYAAWLGTTRAVGCANGTDALALILRGLGIGEGSTVVTVSHTAGSWNGLLWATRGQPPSMPLSSELGLR